MKQKTVLEWLIKQMAIGNIKTTQTKCGYMIEFNNDVFKEGILLEKENIVHAFEHGMCNEEWNGRDFYAKYYENESYDSTYQN